MRHRHHPHRRSSRHSAQSCASYGIGLEGTKQTAASRTKTDSVVLTRKNKYDNLEVLVEGLVIPIKQSMRYLGVDIDTRLTFTKHIQQTSRNATDSAKAIGRLMPNLGGPLQRKRALLGTVASSKMLYASPIWAVRGTNMPQNWQARRGPLHSTQYVLTEQSRPTPRQYLFIFIYIYILRQSAVNNSTYYVGNNN